MKLKKILGLLIVFVMMLSLTAGCDGETPETPVGGTTTTPQNTGGGTDHPTPGGDDNTSGERNLGGLEVTIGIWWTPEDSDPETEFGRARLAYLNDMQSKYNFTIRQTYITGHSGMAQIARASIIAGKPDATIFTLDPSNVLAMYKDGLFLDVGSLPSVDLHAEKWNRHIIDAMTFDGGIYGFVHGYNQWNAGVVFFNKNVLRESGIDPDVIYDLQAGTGEWTSAAGTTYTEWVWDAMLAMAEQATRLNADGTYASYGFCTFSKDTLTNAIFSNGGRYIGKDENGRFINATNTTAFLRATEWVQNLQYNNLLQPPPEGNDWNWWIEGFNEGRAAFRVHQDYSKSDMKNTTFDWGIALFPRGPDATQMMSAYYENINVVPRTFVDVADDIMFAYDLYTEPVPGFEDDDDAWKYGAYNDYRDMRAVDETLAMIRTGDYTAVRFEFIIPGFDTGEIADTMWNLEATPAELVEAASQEWNRWIEQANGWIFGE